LNLYKFGNAAQFSRPSNIEFERQRDAAKRVTMTFQRIFVKTLFILSLCVFSFL